MLTLYRKVGVNMSNVIRLNNNCLSHLEKIRKLLPDLVDPKVIDVSTFSNSKIIENCLHNYADELEISLELSNVEDPNERF